MGAIFCIGSIIDSKKMDEMKRVVVIGASSLIGHFLLPRLVAEKYSVVAISRNPDEKSAALAGCEWRRVDIGESALSVTPPYALIHLAPLWLLPELLQRSSSLPERIIAFSSTSRISKSTSTSEQEREVADKLAQAEEHIARVASELAIPWTIFRPTLIYGAGLDKNVTTIAHFIRRFRFLPLVGKAEGKRMPVHADDLAVACLNCFAQENTQNKIYNLSGGEALRYREMVARIFHALGKKPRFLPLPRQGLERVLGLLAYLPRFSHVTPEMVNRMSQDLVFDSAEAVADFGYSPRKFNPTKADLMGEG